MLAPVFNHPWDLAPKQAVALQRELADQVELCDDLKAVRTVAGVDVGIRDDTALAAVVVLSYPDLGVMEKVTADRPVSYPYVPGLLTFREAPTILVALATL